MTPYYLTLALLAGQIQPPQGGDPPLRTERHAPAPSVDGTWVIEHMELAGRPVPLGRDATATIRNNVITFAQGDRPESIRLEFAPRNVLLGSYPTAADLSPSNPQRRNPQDLSEERGDRGYERGTGDTGLPAPPDREPVNRKQDSTRPNDPGTDRVPPVTSRDTEEGPDVGGTSRSGSGRTATPRTADRGTGEGSKANQVTGRASYNTGLYVLSRDYLVLSLNLPLHGPTETIGQRDRRPIGSGGSPSTVGPTGGLRRTTGPNARPDPDYGPDVKVNSGLVLILKKKPSYR